MRSMQTKSKPRNKNNTEEKRMPEVAHYETTFESMFSHIEKTIKTFYTAEELHKIPIETLGEQQIEFAKSLASTESNLENLAHENEKLNATHLIQQNVFTPQ